MSIRTTIANTLISTGRSLGRSGDAELAVDVSDHSISVAMEEPDKTQRAWDSNLYRRGNLFIDGYANPVKPSVQQHKELATPDEAKVIEGQPEDDSPPDDDEPHVDLIASPRYRAYMRQDLISQLLNPRAQWRLIAYAVIALAVFMAVNIVVSLAAAGVL
jgi:hypothetical protein